MRPSPTLRRLFGWTISEIVFGRTHVSIVYALKKIDPLVAKSAPVFFDFSLRAHADAALMCANRLFDKNASALSIHVLLSTVSTQTDAFRFATSQEIREIVKDSKSRISSVERELRVLRTRRNQGLAHMDPGTIHDPKEFNQRSALTFRELGNIFDEAAIIVDRLWRRYVGQVAPTFLADAGDCENAFRLISEGMRRKNEPPGQNEQ